MWSSKRERRLPPHFALFDLYLPQRPTPTHVIKTAFERRRSSTTLQLVGPPVEPSPPTQLNDLFHELLHLIALLLENQDRAQLRAVCKNTWQADKNFRLPRPLQQHLESFHWWRVRSIATWKQRSKVMHLIRPWGTLCDTPAFWLFDRTRMVPTLDVDQGTLVFRACVYWPQQQQQQCQRYELELLNEDGVSKARFNNSYYIKGVHESAADCLLRGLPELAPGLWAYLHEAHVLPGWKLTKWSQMNDCFYVLVSKR